MAGFGFLAFVVDLTTGGGLSSRAHADELRSVAAYRPAQANTATATPRLVIWTATPDSSAILTPPGSGTATVEDSGSPAPGTPGADGPGAPGAGTPSSGGSGPPEIATVVAQATWSMATAEAEAATATAAYAQATAAMATWAALRDNAANLGSPPPPSPTPPPTALPTPTESAALLALVAGPGAGATGPRLPWMDQLAEGSIVEMWARYGSPWGELPFLRRLTVDRPGPLQWPITYFLLIAAHVAVATATIVAVLKVRR